MPTELNRLINTLEEQRCALLAKLEDLRPGILNAKPAADKWSILEILEHVVLAEQVILQGLPSWEALVERRRRLKHRALFQLVMVILRFAIPVRVPSRRMNPGGRTSLAELRRDWEAHGRWLRAYEDEFDPDGRRKAVFLHPVAGPITLVQALRMNLLHLRVHGRQIERLQRAAAATAGRS